MKEQKILVLGGNGKTGRRVVERLTQIKGVSTRIGSRQENPAFDWEESSGWPTVISGVDAVYITFQPDLAVPTAPDKIREFTTLATSLGVQKVVLLSGRGEKEAEACEEIVKSIAKTWTIVRASWFNQNFSEGFFLEPVHAGHVALPRAETLEPFTDAVDIADVVVAALVNDKHQGQTYELTGPRLLTFKDAVSEIAKATGRDIAFQDLSLQEYTDMLRQYQVPEEVVWLANYLFTEVLDGRNASVTADIEKVLGRKPRDFSHYVRETAATGIWNSKS